MIKNILILFALIALFACVSAIRIKIDNKETLLNEERAKAKKSVSHCSKRVTDLVCAKKFGRKQQKCINRLNTRLTTFFRKFQKHTRSTLRTCKCSTKSSKECNYSTGNANVEQCVSSYVRVCGKNCLLDSKHYRKTVEQKTSRIASAICKGKKHSCVRKVRAIFEETITFVRSVSVRKAEIRAIYRRPVGTKKDAQKEAQYALAAGEKRALHDFMKKNVAKITDRICKGQIGAQYAYCYADVGSRVNVIIQNVATKTYLRIKDCQDKECIKRKFSGKKQYAYVEKETIAISQFCSNNQKCSEDVLRICAEQFQTIETLTETIHLLQTAAITKTTQIKIIKKEKKEIKKVINNSSHKIAKSICASKSSNAFVECYHQSEVVVKKELKKIQKDVKQQLKACTSTNSKDCIKQSKPQVEQKTNKITLLCAGKKDCEVNVKTQVQKAVKKVEKKSVVIQQVKKIEVKTEKKIAKKTVEVKKLKKQYIKVQKKGYTQQRKEIVARIVKVACAKHQGKLYVNCQHQIKLSVKKFYLRVRKHTRRLLRACKCQVIAREKCVTNNESVTVCQTKHFKSCSNSCLNKVKTSRLSKLAANICKYGDESGDNCKKTVESECSQYVEIVQKSQIKFFSIKKVKISKKHLQKKIFTTGPAKTVSIKTEKKVEVVAPKKTETKKVVETKVVNKPVVETKTVVTKKVVTKPVVHTKIVTKEFETKPVVEKKVVTKTVVKKPVVEEKKVVLLVDNKKIVTVKKEIVQIEKKEVKDTVKATYKKVAKIVCAPNDKQCSSNIKKEVKDHFKQVKKETKVILKKCGCTGKATQYCSLSSTDSTVIKTCTYKYVKTCSKQCLKRSHKVEIATEKLAVDLCKHSKNPACAKKVETHCDKAVETVNKATVKIQVVNKVGVTENQAKKVVIEKKAIEAKKAEEKKATEVNKDIAKKLQDSKTVEINKKTTVVQVAKPEENKSIQVNKKTIEIQKVEKKIDAEIKKIEKKEKKEEKRIEKQLDEKKIEVLRVENQIKKVEKEIKKLEKKEKKAEENKHTDVQIKIEKKLAEKQFEQKKLQEKLKKVEIEEKEIAQKKVDLKIKKIEKEIKTIEIEKAVEKKNYIKKSEDKKLEEKKAVETKLKNKLQVIQNEEKTFTTEYKKAKEEKKVEEKKYSEEVKKLHEKKLAEAKKFAEEQQKIAEQKKVAEENKEIEKIKIAEQKKIAEEKKAIEEQKKIAAEKKKVASEKVIETEEVEEYTEKHRYSLEDKTKYLSKFCNCGNAKTEEEKTACRKQCRSKLVSLKNEVIDRSSTQTCAEKAVIACGSDSTGDCAKCKQAFIIICAEEQENRKRELVSFLEECDDTITENY